MANQWDDTFETLDELLASEWNDHVTDQKNHSGRHESGGSDELDVSGLSGVLADPQDPQTETVQDIVDGLLTAGAKIGLTYDDPNDTLTIDTTALNEEEVEDVVGNLVTAGNAITVNYDDPNDTLTIAVDESSLSFYDGTNLTANVDNQSVSTDLATINDTNTDPSSVGEMRQNAGDVKVYSGGGVKNISNIGSGSGALSDSGTDNADGGDQYVLPQTQDSIDLQSGGAIENAENIDSAQYAVGGNTALTSVAASGSVTLSSGAATVDTGISESTSATFMLAIGPDTDDAQVAGDIQAVSGGNYEVQIEETDTSVGNPTVRYDVIRVR